MIIRIKDIEVSALVDQGLYYKRMEMIFPSLFITWPQSAYKFERKGFIALRSNFFIYSNTGYKL